MYLGRNGWMRAAVLIDYNTTDPEPRAGSGFFVHAWRTGHTDGCVGVPLAFAEHLLAWLTPADHPRVVLAVAPRRG